MFKFYLVVAVLLSCRNIPKKWRIATEMQKHKISSTLLITVETIASSNISKFVSFRYYLVEKTSSVLLPLSSFRVCSKGVLELKMYLDAKISKIIRQKFLQQVFHIYAFSVDSNLCQSFSSLPVMLCKFIKTAKHS